VQGAIGVSLEEGVGKRPGSGGTEVRGLYGSGDLRDRCGHGQGGGRAGSSGDGRWVAGEAEVIAVGLVG